MLHVSSVDKKSAGKYKCYVYNHADVISSDQLELNEFNRTVNLDKAKSKTVTLTYEPDPATNVAFFIMVGSSFCIAFVINLVRHIYRGMRSNFFVPIGKIHYISADTKKIRARPFVSIESL